MSNTQPEALRLAEWCETFTHNEMEATAAELRRLHALNAELLYALKRALKELDRDWDGCVNSRKGETIFAIRKVINETN